MTDTERLIADFRARGGVIKRVARTKRTMNEGQLAQAIRGKDPSVSPTEERAAWKRHDEYKRVYGRGW